MGDWGCPVTWYAAREGRSDLPLRIWRDLDQGSPQFPEAVGRAAAAMAADGRRMWVVVVGADPVTVDADPRLSKLLETYHAVGSARFQLVTVIQFAPGGQEIARG